MMIRKVLVIIFLLTISFAQKDYTNFVKTLKSKISDQQGSFYHSAYDRLAYISDTYGPRVWGSDVLQTVINEMKNMATKEGFENIRLQPVNNFTKWIRGKQELILYSPRPSPQQIDVIGLGMSVPANLKADAIVFRNFDEMQAKKNQIKGKIVIYNQQWQNYGQSVAYRINGAEKAASYGAVAALVRSVASMSVSSVHTGVQFNRQIPIAAITVEDAEMFQRMQDRGQKITLQLTLENQIVENASSNNLVFQIKGGQKPQQILLMGGHIDSWDTGSQTGANDDGGGFITCFQALRLLLQNGFRPKRTLRFIAWSGQEWANDKSGNRAYERLHLNQLDKHIVAFEDDLGSTRLKGFGYTGPIQGKALIQQIALKYLSIINASLVTDDGGGADTAPLYQHGVPMMANSIQDNESHDYYFAYHHSAGDTMSVMNADDLDSNVLGVACMFYILADLDITIPRLSKFNLMKQ